MSRRFNPWRISIATIVVFVIIWGSVWLAQERSQRIALEDQLIETARLLEEVKAAKKDLQLALEAERQITSALTKEISIKTSETEIAVNRLEEQQRILQHFIAQLAREQQARKQAEEELASARKVLAGVRKQIALQPIELEKIVVQVLPRGVLKGRVIAVNEPFAFVVVDLGSQNQLQVGNLLEVVRGDAVISQIKVERVTEEVSAASIVPETLEGKIQIDDVVRMIQTM